MDSDQKGLFSRGVRATFLEGSQVGLDGGSRHLRWEPGGSREEDLALLCEILEGRAFRMSPSAQRRVAQG